MRLIAIPVSLLLVVAMVPLAAAQPATVPSALLGDLFESNSYGIAFRPPAGSTKLKIPGADEIVEFRHDDKDWRLTVAVRSFPSPRPLPEWRDRQNQPRMGLLGQSLQQMLATAPGAKVEREDVVDFGEYQVGIIIIRYKLGTQSRLRQMGLVQANDQLYYIFKFDAKAGNTVGDADEQALAATFSDMLDSIKLLDRTKIVDDQNRRLLRTRALFLDWTDKRLTDVLVPQQWFRIIHGGKDVGWTYIEEMTGQQRKALNGTFLPGSTTQKIADDELVTDDGLVVYQRLWMRNDEGSVAESGTEMFVTFDRKREIFAAMRGLTPKGKKINTIIEVGQSLQQFTRKFLFDDPEAVGIKDDKDARNPVSRQIETYALNTQLSGLTGAVADAKPVTIDVGAGYLPQALGALLPRLLPLTEIRQDPKTYMFYSYVPAIRQVMARYADVNDREQPVTLAGRTFQAVSVSDRLGLDGSPTIYYLSLDSKYGTYVGSYTKDGDLTTLTSTAEELSRIWPDAQFTRPQQVSAPDNMKAATRRAVNDGN